MARIKIEELPVMEEMKNEELKGIFGGLLVPSVQKGFGGFGQGGMEAVEGGLRFSRVVAPEDSDIDIPFSGFSQNGPQSYTF